MSKSDTVVDARVLSALVAADEAEKRKTSRVNFSQATPTRTRVAVPEECKGFSTPENIRAFIELMHPNMAAYVGAHIPKNIEGDSRGNAVNDIIDNFVGYILGEATEKNGGGERWLRYDPVGFAKMPYYKWFLRQLDFFRKDYQRKAYKDQQTFSLSETDYDFTADNPANKAINIDTLDVAQEVSDPVSDISLIQIQQYLQAYSGAALDGKSFEAHAFRLFEAKMDDVPTKDIAANFGISPSAVGQWMTRLRTLLASDLEITPAALGHRPRAIKAA